MLKRALLILILLAVLLGFGWLIYDQIFAGSSQTADDVTMSEVEGSFQDKERVEAECEITTDNQFCFKDTVWAQQQNAVEFDGYLVVEYTNKADIIEEISISTIKLENITEGKLIIHETRPSEIFIEPGKSTKIRYAFYFDVSEDLTEEIKSNGIELKTTFTNVIGKKATENYTIEYSN